MNAPPILPYGDRPAFGCHPYDRRYAAVADVLAQLMHSADRDLAIEHVGSTAVSGCPGKGFIDLLVVAPSPEEVRTACRTLGTLGFQPHDFGQPSPGFRGGIEYDRTFFRVHVQVTHMRSQKHLEMVRFRDLLRSHPALAAAYAERKRSLINQGINQNPAYTRGKSPFIEEVLRCPVMTGKDTPAET